MDKFDKKFIKNICKNITRFRKVFGWSQSDLSRKSGLSCAAISSGNREPSLLSLKKLSIAFMIPVSVLINESYHDFGDKDYLMEEFGDLVSLSKEDKYIVLLLIKRLKYGTL